MGSIDQAINGITEKDWQEIKRLSVAISANLVGLGWVNNKCYWLGPKGPDGTIEQVAKHGDREIPYERNFFKETSARFSLPGVPVAYFSNDFAVNCCELIEQYRMADGLTWEDFQPYLNGQVNPTPCLYWYPLSAKLDQSALVLDLLNQSIALPERLSKLGGWPSRGAFEAEVLLNRSPSVYPQTQVIAQAAWDNGFNALSYPSVRTPSGISLNNRNLVVFQEAFINRLRC